MKTAFPALIALLLAGCDVAGLRGNGHIVTDQRTLAPFINFEAGGAFDIDWQSGPPSISITTDENLLPEIEVRVSDNKLTVRSRDRLRPTRSVKLKLTSSALEGVSLSGASRLNARQLHGPRFYLESSGASKVTADGAVDDLVAEVTGAGDLRAESLQTKSATLSITGAGDARIAVSDNLKASITGAGKVEYRGNPQVERHITGAGSIRRRD